MKTNNALILGGWYLLFNIPLAFCQNTICETLDNVLFFAFLIFLVGLCFKKIPPFISRLKNFPNLSVYMASLGIIPYFWLSFELLIWILVIFFPQGAEQQLAVLKPIFEYENIIQIGLIFTALLFALIRHIICLHNKNLAL